MTAASESLKRAILAYDMQAAERALREGAHPDVLIGQRRARSPLFPSYFAPNRYLALHLAAHDDDAELAALLLLHGANPLAAIYRGVLPISIAAKHNHLRVAEILLYEYERPSGNFAYCPLSLAAGEGHLEMVELLLQKRADQMNLHGALSRAVSKKGNLVVTRRLLAAGARAGHLLPGAGDPPTTIRMHALRFLPEAIPLFAGHTQHRLIDAAADGDLAEVTRRLDGGESADDASFHGYETALTAASRGGHLDVVQRLLDRGATLRGPQSKADPLMSALRGGHVDTAQRLWSVGCRSKNMLGSSILYGLPMSSVVWAVDREEPDLGFVAYTAARVSRIDVMRFALERGADPNFDKFGRTSLMLAASRNALEIVELLIEHGADVHACDDEGHSALDYAIAINDMDDPEDPFEYTDTSVAGAVAQRLQRLGLKLPR